MQVAQSPRGIENVSLLQEVAHIEVLLDELLQGEKLGADTREWVKSIRDAVNNFVEQAKEVYNWIDHLADRIEENGDEEGREYYFTTVEYAAEMLVAGGDETYIDEIDEHLETRHTAMHWIKLIHDETDRRMFAGKEGFEILREIHNKTHLLSLKIRYARAKLLGIGARMLTELTRDNAKQIANELRLLTIQLI